MNQDSTVYFGYGSNLDEIQVRARCPSARIIGPAFLPGYRLAFCGYSLRWDGGTATAIRDRKSKVQGILFEITPEGLCNLDTYEGHPWIYLRRKMWVVDEKGRRIKAIVYLARDQEPNTPSPEYLDVLYQAYRKFRFDEQALRAAVKEAKHG